MERKVMELSSFCWPVVAGRQGSGRARGDQAKNPLLQLRMAETAGGGALGVTGEQALQQLVM